MAACGSLHHIFENPLPEKPSLLDSLSSRNQINPLNPIHQSSFTEIFGELHFKDSSGSSSSSEIKSNYSSCQKNGDAYSSVKWESLQLCTEGLGSESSDDIEDLQGEMNEQWQNKEEKVNITKHFQPKSLTSESRRTRTSWGTFPPPISCIGKSGKPWISFKSYREDGRFVLKEIRTPTHEFLHASREDGRLKLQLVQPNQEISEEEDDRDEEEEEEEEGLDGVDNGEKEAINAENNEIKKGN